MGSCGSKRADAKTVDVQATSPSTKTVGIAAQSTEATSIDAKLRKFHVTLAKTSADEALGMTLSFPAKNKLRVKALKETGLVITYNSNQLHTPEQQVQPGDDIIVVNGVSGDSDLMLKQLRSQNLVLEVLRDFDGEKTAVEVPAGNPLVEQRVAHEPAVSSPEMTREVKIYNSETAVAPSLGTTQEETPAAVSPAQGNVELRASQAEEIVVEPEEEDAPETKGCNLWCQ